MSLNNIKAMMFDIDGTLLKRDCTMSPKTYEALVRLKERNVKLIINTGRPSIATLKLLKDNFNSIELFDSFYCNNGVEFYDCKTGKSFFFSSIKKEILTKLNDYFIEDYLVLSYYDKEIKFLKCNHSIKNSHLFDNWANRRCASPIIIDFNKDAEDVYKLLILFDESKSEEIASKINNMPKGDYSIFKTGFDSYEILPKGYSKGTSVRKFLEESKLNKDEVLCFGDEENDIPALLEATGCIVGNKSYKDKYNIPYLCKNVDEDGVYYFLLEKGLI